MMMCETVDCLTSVSVTHFLPVTGVLVITWYDRDLLLLLSVQCNPDDEGRFLFVILIVHTSAG